MTKIVNYEELWKQSLENADKEIVLEGWYDVSFQIAWNNILWFKIKNPIFIYEYDMQYDINHIHIQNDENDYIKNSSNMIDLTINIEDIKELKFNNLGMIIDTSGFRMCINKIVDKVKMKNEIKSK